MAAPLLDSVPDDRENHTRSSRQRLGLDASVRARRLGLFLPLDLSFELWQRIGDQLGVLTNSSAWWLGDWLVYGEKSFPNRYRTAIVETSLSYKTLRNYAWVARKFPMSRRRDTLSLQHHAEVAGLPVDEQERWLTRAEVEGWSQKRLRKEIHSSSHAQDERVTVTITVEVSSEREQRWKAAAQASSVSLPEWIAYSLDQAVDHIRVT